MRRAALERERTLREWRKHRAIHVRHAQEMGAFARNWAPGVSPSDLVTCACDNQAGRFRKGQRWLSKGSQFHNPRSYGCRTLQEARSDADFLEQLAEAREER
tara:strand:+ start:660 stop:965 length:306 start_codon:yes stop_codon:yes gene_type:complete